MRTITILVMGALGALMFSLPAAALEGDSLWSRVYGGSEDEYGYFAQETSDGGFIIAGYTDSYGAGYDDFYLVKTNAAGDTLWTRTFGGDSYDEARSVQQTQDGGYIIAGTSFSFGSGWYSDVYVIKTDAAGRTVWARTYGGQYDDEGYSIQQTDDGGYVIAGNTGMAASYNDNVYLVKTDASGDTLWTRNFGGDSHDWGYCVQQTQDGGYILSGFTRPAVGYDDLYLVRCNSSGDTLWTRSFGELGDEEGNCVRQTADGGFIVAGFTTSYGVGGGDAWLIRLDENGNTIWMQTYGDSTGDYATWVEPTPDGGFIAAGYSNLGDPYRNVYLFKTDASGTLLWQRFYGGDGNEDGYSIQPTADGNYILAGETSTFATGGNDIWLLKIEGSGAGIEPQPLLSPASFILYPCRPNPFNSTTVISYQLSALNQVSLKVYDTAGRLVRTLVEGWRMAGTHQVTFDGTGLAAGIYFVRLEAGDFRQTQKLVLVK